jgi:hypothetical protein
MFMHLMNEANARVGRYTFTFAIAHKFHALPPTHTTHIFAAMLHDPISVVRNFRIAALLNFRVTWQQIHLGCHAQRSSCTCTVGEPRSVMNSRAKQKHIHLSNDLHPNTQFASKQYDYHTFCATHT